MVWGPAGRGPVRVPGLTLILSRMGVFYRLDFVDITFVVLYDFSILVENDVRDLTGAPDEAPQSHTVLYHHGPRHHLQQNLLLWKGGEAD